MVSLSNHHVSSKKSWFIVFRLKCDRQYTDLSNHFNSVKKISSNKVSENKEDKKLFLADGKENGG
jgi:hypothetical protein